MPSTDIIDQDMAEKLASAQQGKDILAEMVVDLETQLDQTKAEKAASYLDNSTLANELRRIEGKLAEVSGERDSLLESNATEKSRFAKSVDELNAQLDAIQFEKEAATKALRRNEDASRLERNNLEEQLRKSHKFNDDLNEQLASKEIDLARTSSQASEAKTVSRSERQMRELFEGHLSEAKNHQDHLRNRMRELEAEAAEATKQYHAATDTIYSLQDQISEIKQQKADALKAARQDHAMLSSEIANQRSEMATLDRDNTALNKAVDELRSSLKALQADHTHQSDEKAISDAELARARAKIVDAAKDEELLCAQLEQLKDTVQMFSSEKQGLLQQKSGDKETYMEELRTLRGALNIAQSNTEAALTQVRTEKNSMIAEIAEISEQLSAAKAEVSSLTRQLDSTEGVVAQALADKEELEAERRFLEGEVKELQDSLKNTRVEAETKAIENQELQVLMRSQEVEIHDDRADLHRSKGEQALMLRDTDEIRSTFEKLRDENELLHAQVAQLQDHIANSEVRMRQLEMQTAQIPTLQREAMSASQAAATAEQAAQVAQMSAEAQVAAAHSQAHAQVAHGLSQAQLQAETAMSAAAAHAANAHAAGLEQAHAAAAHHAHLGAATASLAPQVIAMNPDMKLVVGENERFRDRVMALEEELAQTRAAAEVDRSILEEQLHHAEARAEKAELVDEIEDKLRAALEEIARLESEMLNTRAEAAERDIQWQAEVDALAETYAQLQAELKQRERDIEEMKEGAWLSAELQYMAKKVEEMELEARQHIAEQRAQLEKLEDTEVELDKMRAERLECHAQIRAIEEELHDEQLANKDLLLEVSSLRDEVSRAVGDKEHALESAENYLKRTLEGQNADRDTLKGALKELGSSLETIRSDKERQLAERDATISDLKASLSSREADLDGALNAIAGLEKQLEVAQAVLKASLVSASQRFGATVLNHRAGLFRYYFQGWYASVLNGRTATRIEELEYRCMLLQDAGKMMALKRIIGRWKNQGLHYGWVAWRELAEERLALMRMNNMLANMTAEQRKRALERLNSIIGTWKGEHFQARWNEWKEMGKEGAKRRHREAYLRRRTINYTLAKGWRTWKDWTFMSTEDRLHAEINQLKFSLRHTYASWMREKLQYEATGWSKYQTQRLFGTWKNFTFSVARVTQKVHLILGTVHRVKKQNAFKDFAQACSVSRFHRTKAALDVFTLEAKKKALTILSRIINHHWLANTGQAWKDWLEYTQWSIDEKNRSSTNAALRRAEEQGYNRARGQLDGEILDLRDALKSERALSFYQHIENLLESRERQSKVWSFSIWRQFHYGFKEHNELEKSKATISDLRSKLSASEGNASNYLAQANTLQRELRELQSAERLSAEEREAKVRELEYELSNLRANNEQQIQRLSLDKRSLENQVELFETERSGMEKQHHAAVTQLRRDRDRIDSDLHDSEQEIEQRDATIRNLKQQNKKLINEYTDERQRLEESMEHLNSENSNSKKDFRRLQNTLEESNDRLAADAAEKRRLEAQIAEQSRTLARNQEALSTARAQLDDAQESLAIYQRGTGATSSGQNLGGLAGDARNTRGALDRQQF
eukprot:TRINITY_DN1771_c0_g4_i1.p1 TRINITY_DN1771_c0_g4~~TRINITY_DN1771_c0_g4_i1.p1  ORF type:complete len:1584 (+),score=659.40 TRINITY_DN1771_c0_g4_i1:69-4820(+)